MIIRESSQVGGLGLMMESDIAHGPDALAFLSGMAKNFKLHSRPIGVERYGQIGHSKAGKTQQKRTSGDELEHDLPRDGHALMELGDFEANEERADLTDGGLLHRYGVRGGGTTQQQFVRPGEGAIGRVSPKVVEELLIADLNTSETNLIHSLRRELSGMLENNRQESIMLRRWPADDDPIERPMSLEHWILKDLRKVNPLRPTHLGAGLDECRRLLSLRILHHVPNGLVRHVPGILDVLSRAAA